MRRGGYSKAEGDTWKKNGGSSLENREYGRMDPLCRPRNALYPQKLALTSQTSGGRSVDIVRSRTEAAEFVSGDYRAKEM
jgi:hypothetical protein